MKFVILQFVRFLFSKSLFCLSDIVSRRVVMEGLMVMVHDACSKFEPINHSAQAWFLVATVVGGNYVTAGRRDLPGFRLPRSRSFAGCRP
jgi:hypothetical protein